MPYIIDVDSDVCLSVNKGDRNSNLKLYHKFSDVKKNDEHGLIEAKTLSLAQGREREVRVEGGLERTEEEGREKAGWSEVGP